ncbi:hypothetical protein FOA52_003943 [Chlamydomonas sp. UWO 241]|nr:hypothetical protein FOA52_003943 [Chlamydomonas sp. UWO 241]
MRSLLATRTTMHLGSLARTRVASRSPVRVAPFPLHGSTQARSFSHPEGVKRDHEEDERRVETAGVVPASVAGAATAAHETRVAAALQAAESLAKTAVTLRLASQDQGHAVLLKVDQVCARIENIVVAVDSVHARLKIFGDRVEQLNMGGIAAKLGLLIDTTKSMQMQGSEVRGHMGEMEELARLQLEAAESMQQSQAAMAAATDARLADMGQLLSRMEQVLRYHAEGVQFCNVFVGDSVRVTDDVGRPYYSLAGVNDQLGKVVEVDLVSRCCLVDFPWRRLWAKMSELEVVPVCRELELVPVHAGRPVAKDKLVRCVRGCRCPHHGNITISKGSLGIVTREFGGEDDCTVRLYNYGMTLRLPLDALEVVEGAPRTA